MAVGKEIRTKIKSVKNTQKITKAMEMVSASKMRKTQDRMERARPYAKRIRSVIGHISQANPDYKHPFLVEREIKRIGAIIITTDRGLCGGLNTGLFRRVLTDLQEWQDKDVEIDLCLIGSKGVSFFRRLGMNIVAQTTHLGDRPRVSDLIGTVKIMLDAYSEGRIDRLFLMFNDFHNTMSQEPHIETLLPVEPIDKEELQEHWDYIYEPDSRELLEGVLMRYVEASVYRGALENIASEQAARMVAMKAATDNAGEIINDLQLIYNKARQAAITQEISEIVGGAAAV
ncbi:MAG: F0F1 ATP synthase subunit gamma [Gammaproteobacteria bacterium]|nr:F0F1 ATP synthase subunit gamma [Gammaproteobacteria bacterium]MDH3766818.1 F0F1 ATP synthase subunit gamma [Gammaproteobacteria bacterium]